MHNQKTIDLKKEEYKEAYERAEKLLERQKGIESGALVEMETECAEILKKNKVSVNFRSYGNFDEIEISVNNNDQTFWSREIAKIEYEMFGNSNYTKKREVFNLIEEKIEQGSSQDEIFITLQKEQNNFVKDSIKVNYGSGGYNSERAVIKDGVEVTEPVEMREVIQANKEAWEILEKLSEPKFLQRMNKWIVMSSINSVFLEKENANLKRINNEIRESNYLRLSGDLNRSVPKIPMTSVTKEIEQFEDFESHSFTGNMLSADKSIFVRKDLSSESEEVVDMKAKVVKVEIRSESLNGKKRFYVTRFNDRGASEEKSISKSKAFDLMEKFVVVSPKFNNEFNKKYGSEIDYIDRRSMGEEMTGYKNADLSTARTIMEVAESLKERPKNKSKGMKR